MIARATATLPLLGNWGWKISASMTFNLDGAEDKDFVFGTAVLNRIDGKGGDDVIAVGSVRDMLSRGADDAVLIGDGQEAVPGSTPVVEAPGKGTASALLFLSN